MSLDVNRNHLILTPLYLHREKLSHVITSIQLPKVSKSMGSTIIVTSLKENENPSNYTNKKNHTKIKLASDKT